MIEIKRKEDCVGCNACVQRCPEQCISMHEDEHGFLYPQVDKDKCINCTLCEKVCPVINRNEARVPIQCLAAKGDDNELVNNSSSAGIFTLLAQRTIKNNGVVFGAAFNSVWGVEHTYTETMEGLSKFQGSKYVQSIIGNSFIEAERFLKSGREVLFSGTPCHIAGLKRFLNKVYENLICVELICHGIPSPLIWRSYLQSVVGKYDQTDSLSIQDASKIKHIKFRDKKISWRKFCFSIIGNDNKTILSQKHYYNLYLKAYLRNFNLRYSCYNCPARKGRSGADIMLGDFWSVARLYPDFYSPAGVSLILAYSGKGEAIMHDINAETIVIKYEEALNNINIELDVKKPAERDTFFNDFNQFGISALKQYCKRMDSNPIVVILENIYHRIRKVFL